MSMAQTAPAAPFRLVLVLVLATAIGPFALQVFLPALPAIQSSFRVSAADGTAGVQPVGVLDRGLDPVLRPDLGPRSVGGRP